MIQKPSPNFGDRTGNKPVDMLVLHYTDMMSVEAALARMCDPQAAVSAHYLIDEEGTIFQLVDENMRAWHAGVSYWRGECDVNSRSIGIELANPGHSNGLTPFPKVQMESLISLSQDILTRHAISAQNIVGHSDIAPGRKQDPGELFDWQLLAANGIGLWPNYGEAVSVAILPSLLMQIGYETGDRDAIEAFQRHYRPAKIDGVADSETASLAAGLLSFILES